MKKKLQKVYVTYCNLWQWQSYHQILSIIFLNEFIALNVNSDKMIKSMKNVKLNISIATVFPNMQTLKMI